MTQFTEESTSKFADLGWTKIHYNEVGSGEPLVLLHGGGLGSTSWGNFIVNVGPFSEHFRVLAVDAPGWGQSDPLELKEGPRLTLNARAVKELLDVLDIEKASIIGNSMGGATAINIAVDYPERVNRVVMMGAAPVGQPMVYTPLFPTEGIKALTKVYIDPTFENFRAMNDLMVYDGSQVPDDELQRRSANVNEAHRKNWIDGRPLGLSRNLMPELPNVQAPVLLIHGRNDTMAPLELSITLVALLPRAELHVFSQCGHWAQYEHADKFNRLVLDFLLHDD